MSPDLQRILYVEDDDAIAEVAMMTLRMLGDFEVRHCNSGQSGLDAYPDFAPQLVLLDVMMPGMDGCETFARLKATYGEICAPVIFMTARAQTHEQAAYLAQGAAGVIVKPFDPAVLCTQIGDIWTDVQAA